MYFITNFKFTSVDGDLGNNEIISNVTTLKLNEEAGTNEKKDNEDNKNSKDDQTEGDTDNQNDDDELNVSLAAMEEKLKPKVLKDFDDITKLFKKLQKSSVDFINSDSKNTTVFLRI